MDTTLTQEEFSPEDFERAAAIAAALGYGENTAYTSSSALVGLFCLPFNPRTADGRPIHGGCIIKTRELGLLFVQTADEDIGVFV